MTNFQKMQAAIKKFLGMPLPPAKPVGSDALLAGKLKQQGIWIAPGLKIEHLTPDPLGECRFLSCAVQRAMAERN